MNASSTFFKLFPPPAFLTMPHAGLDISDDGIRCIRYDGSGHARRVGLAAALDFPVGLVDSGDVKDAVEFASLIKDFALKHRIGRVRVSIPEEKVYLFETEVSGTDTRSITQNIEFKLEENVPLSAADALFYYALMPGGPVGGPNNRERCARLRACRAGQAERRATANGRGSSPPCNKDGTPTPRRAAQPSSDARCGAPLQTSR